MDPNQWTELRDSLLHLHKMLLDYQRAQYEGKFGKVPSPGALLGLVMENPQFAWLRQISELVVGIDELLESKEKVDAQKYKDMLAYCKKLFQPKQDGSVFAKNYYRSIHSDPGVALSHSKIKALLEKNTP